MNVLRDQASISVKIRRSGYFMNSSVPAISTNIIISDTEGTQFAPHDGADQMETLVNEDSRFLWGEKNNTYV